MAKTISLYTAVLVLAISTCSYGQNWQKFKGKGKICKPSYFLNMKPLKRIDAKHLQVSQRSTGFQTSGIIELSSEKVPMFGEGFVDIGVHLERTQNGVDYWKECKL